MKRFMKNLSQVMAFMFWYCATFRNYTLPNRKPRSIRFTTYFGWKLWILAASVLLFYCILACKKFFFLILVPFPALFLFIFLIFCLQYWYNIHPWWWADTPAAALESPAAALGKICSDTFLLLDFPGLNQGRGAGRYSNPGLPYSNRATR